MNIYSIQNILDNFKNSTKFKSLSKTSITNNNDEVF